MSNASATTITVNTALFAAGDTVQITNLGVGVCTITAGTATVNTSASLALAQYESGTLDFTSTSAAIFIKGAGAAAAAAKVLQVVSATYSTEAQNNTSTYADTGLTATITPTLATSKILVTVHQTGIKKNDSTSAKIRLLRGATSLIVIENEAGATNVASTQNSVGGTGCTYLDSPATTSATTYKTQFLSVGNISYARLQQDNSSSTITLMEIGA
jgi:hypothetical protein